MLFFLRVALPDQLQSSVLQQVAGVEAGCVDRDDYDDAA